LYGVEGEWLTKTTKTSPFPLLVPTTEADLVQIIFRSHFGPGNHDGRDRTLDSVKQFHFFSGLRPLLVRVLASCLHCQTHRGAAPVEELHPQLTTRKNERHYVDFTYPHSVDEFGMQYILVLKDHFTKYVWAWATQRKDAGTVQRALEEVWTSGNRPQHLCSDNGAEFRAQTAVLAAQHLVEQNKGLPYKPQVQGAVEVFNKYVKPKLYARVQEYASQGVHKSWSEVLPEVVATYNETPNQATGTSPAWLHLGVVRHPLRPAVQLDAKVLAELEEKARQKQVAQARRMVRQHERLHAKRKATELPVETRVLVRRPRGVSKSSFPALWGCAARVHEVRTPSGRAQPWYRLQWITEGYNGEQPGSLSKRQWRLDKLKELSNSHTDEEVRAEFKASQPGAVRSRPRAFKDEATDVYDLESLLARRKRAEGTGRVRVEYLVKWLNWDYADSTWEPSYVSSCTRKLPSRALVRLTARVVYA
jgi:hypothetical protein